MEMQSESISIRKTSKRILYELRSDALRWMFLVTNNVDDLPSDIDSTIFGRLKHYDHRFACGSISLALSDRRIKLPHRHARKNENERSNAGIS